MVLKCYYILVVKSERFKKVGILLYHSEIMVNPSKINDPRFWARWRAYGSVGDKYETDRRVAINHYRNQMKTLGNLTRHEIRELEQFEFREGPSTIDQQVRRYHLKLKSENPERAARVLAETSPIISQGSHSIGDVEKLCRTLHGYLSGFLIRYGGESYSMHNNRFGTVSSIY